MRVTLADATLARHAGRFVWLSLDYDKEGNQQFLAGHGVEWTPVFFVLDPAAGRVTASHIGGMTLAEVHAFLDQGERGVKGGPRSAAEIAIAAADAEAGRGAAAAATRAFREALRIAAPGSPERRRAVDALTST